MSRPITAQALELYRDRQMRLDRIARTARTADRQRGTDLHRELREGVAHHSHRFDLLEAQLPAGWRSWDELGEAIERAIRPGTGAQS